MKKRNGFFKTSDGSKLFYSINGEGPPLLFCYGLVCSSLHWQYQIDYFKKDHTVIWFDYRGHQNSPLPENPATMTIDTFAKDALTLLDELEIPKVTVLGHSLGVNVVLDLYKLAPKRVKAMVLANGIARNAMESVFGTNLLQYIVPMLEGLYRKSPKLVNRLWRANGSSWLTQKLVAWGGFNPSLAKESDIAKYIEQFSQTDLIVTLTLMKSYEHYNALPWLHKIKVPTLIISGEKDMVTPKDSQILMHQLIPGSRLDTVRNGSHCPQLDIPELINIMIERFLREHDL